MAGTQQILAIMIFCKSILLYWKRYGLQNKIVLRDLGQVTLRVSDSSSVKFDSILQGYCDDSVGERALSNSRHSTSGSSSKHSKSPRPPSIQHLLCIRHWARRSNTRVRAFTKDKRDFKLQEDRIHFVAPSSTAPRKLSKDHVNLPPAPSGVSLYSENSNSPKISQPHSERFFFF